jgi:hypothetical protein
VSPKATATAKPTGDDAVREKIASLPAFRDVAERLHEVILAAAPELRPRLWYGMPGYATGTKQPVLCFFRVDDDRFVTFGLTEHAHHEPEPGAGHQLMASAWFLTELDPPTEARIAAIVRRAVS